jgi:hypothetical protein
MTASATLENYTTLTDVTLADDLRIATTSLAKDGKGMCQSKSSGYSDYVSNPFRQFMREPWSR